MSIKITDGLTVNQRYYRRLGAEGREKSRLSSRQWREANRERSREIGRQSYAKRIELRLADAREKFKRLKEAGYSDVYRARDRHKKECRRARKQGAVVAFTDREWQVILMAHNYACAYCGHSGAALEQDHVVPLSKGGAHIAANIVPACKPCNSSKGNRLDWRGRCG